MANVAINEQHLVDIAQAIREKSGIPEGTPIMEISKTPNVTDKETADTSTGYGNGRKLFDTTTIPGASTIQVELTIHTESTNYDYLQILPGTVTTAAGFSGATKYGGTKKTTQVLTFENTDTISFYFCSDSSNCSFFGYYAEVTGLDADGELITDGIPAETYRPGDMAAAIASIVAGSVDVSGGVVKYVQLKNEDGAQAKQLFDASAYIGKDDDKAFMLVVYSNFGVSAASALPVVCVPNILYYDGKGTYSDIVTSTSSLNISSYITPASCTLENGVIGLTNSTGNFFKIYQSSSTSTTTNTIDLIYVVGDTGDPGWVKPEGELQITKNDTYDVTDYATVVVNVEGSGGDAGGAGGAITSAHKNVKETLSNGTLTFDLSATGGNFTVLLPTTSTSYPYQLFVFNNGAIVKQNMYQHTSGRMYSLPAGSATLMPTYSDGVLSVPVTSDGTTLISEWVTFFYVATA